MPGDGNVVVIGGTSGLGRAVAQSFAAEGRTVVLTSRTAERAHQAATELGPSARGLALDLRHPKTIAAALQDVGPVDSLVVAGMERDQNNIRDYDVERALELVTQKLVGYSEVVHTLLDRMSPETAIVLFGGTAKDKPYPGSTTVTSVNGGVVGMVRAMAMQLAPIRVNAIHPGIVQETPYWSGRNLDYVIEGTLTKRFVTAADIVDAVRFLLENRSVNAIDLVVDGGWSIPWR